MKKSLIFIFILGILLMSSVLALDSLESLDGQRQEQTQTFTQTVTVTVLPGGMEIYSPIQGHIYNERMIPIDLTLSNKAKYIRYSDNNGDPVTICRNCDEYGHSSLKRKPFDDGFHQVVFLTVFSSGTVYTQRDFFVDTKKPKITKTEPQGGFADGTFAVEFQEANPVSLILNYGNDEIGMMSAAVDLSGCYEPRRSIERCPIIVDLEDYDTQKINYWFEITDIMGNKDASKPKQVSACVFPCDSSYFPI